MSVIISVSETVIASVRTRSIEARVGDYVIVQGPYAASAYDQHAVNTVAVGWQRRVIRILPGTNWPVLFGDDNKNPTGWTTAANLKFLRRGSF